MDGVIAAGHPSLQRGAQIFALLEAGRIAQARDLAAQAYADAVAGHALIAQMWLATQLGRVEYYAGRMAASHAWFATATAIAADHHFRSGQWLALVGLALAAAGMADAGAARTACQRAGELSPAGHRRADVAAAACWAAAAAGDLSRARGMLADAAELARATGSRTSEAMLLCDIARLGDPARVRDRLRQLAAETDSALTAARAAHAAALADRDPLQLERVADRFEAFGALLLAAEASASAAEFHRRAGDGRLATAATARAARLAACCDGARTPGLARPESMHALTSREREIALLAVHGRSSKEIADQLIVSIRTVESHLQHVYQKMGVNRRKDLRTALATKDR
jgi:DNA-binding CsgD family transcriptional regulator